MPFFYDLAVYGSYPAHEYITFGLQAPSPNVVAWDHACDNGHVLVAPFGDAVPDAGPTILDAKGNLVWTTTGHGIVMNLKVQSYHGLPYLTFWAGKKVGGVGQGYYLMLNSSYDVVHNISARSPLNTPNDIRLGDLHEFIVTDEGTALFTVYNTTNHDLSAMGRPSNGWIVDSLFQEVDIETGELLFEWRASDHFDPATTSLYLNPFGGYKESNPYDFFHINSVQKDRDGNYLISSRHLHAIITVDGKTGEILWILGGEENMFEDLSGGKASNFKWQHDARWASEDDGILSVFDNESAGPIMTDASQSRGLVMQVDVKRKTVKLVNEYFGHNKILSASQGSVQVLDRGTNDVSDKHVLVGWGSSAAYTEFTMDGQVLCETHIAASASFWWERVKTYRALKTFEWIGRPEQPPAAAMVGDRIYVSWNGATEVTAWQLEGQKQGAGEGEWQNVDIKEKVGFEDSFRVPDQSFAAYRVAALDELGELMRHSHVVEHVAAKTASFRWWLFGVFVVVGGSIGVWLFMTKIPRGQRMKYFWDRHRYRKVPGIEMN